MCFWKEICMPWATSCLEAQLSVLCKVLRKYWKVFFALTFLTWSLSGLWAIENRAVNKSWKFGIFFSSFAAIWFQLFDPQVCIVSLCFLFSSQFMDNIKAPCNWISNLKSLYKMTKNFTPQSDGFHLCWANRRMAECNIDPPRYLGTEVSVWKLKLWECKDGFLCHYQIL